MLVVHSTDQSCGMKSIFFYKRTPYFSYVLREWTFFSKNNVFLRKKSVTVTNDNRSKFKRSFILVCRYLFTRNSSSSIFLAYLRTGKVSDGHFFVKDFQSVFPIVFFCVKVKSHYVTCKFFFQ